MGYQDKSDSCKGYHSLERLKTARINDKGKSDSPHPRTYRLLRWTGQAGFVGFVRRYLLR